MLATTENAIYIGHYQSSFVNDKGDNVVFRRVQFKQPGDDRISEIGITEDAYNSCNGLKLSDEVSFDVDIYLGRNRASVRVCGINLSA